MEEDIDNSLESLVPGMAEIIEQNQFEFIQAVEEEFAKCRQRFQLKLKRDILRALQPQQE